MKTEIAFAGQIQPTVCPCHPGQFVITVLQLHPVLGQRIVGTELFETVEKADANMEATVLKFATLVVEAIGMTVDQASEIKIRTGEAAEREINRVFNEGNPELH